MPEDVEKQLIDMGILPEDGLSVDEKKQAIMELLQSGDVDTANMLATVPCTKQEVINLPDTTEVHNFAVGQVWYSDNGKAYEIVGRTNIGWKVQANNESGRATASTSDWLFTNSKMSGFVNEYGLQLYNPTNRIDTLAEMLERAGLMDEASELDSVGESYSVYHHDERLDKLHAQLDAAFTIDDVERITSEMNRIIAETK
jgi:hypothetical protein